MVRCTATTATGKRCRNSAIRGTKYCARHTKHSPIKRNSRVTKKMSPRKRSPNNHKRRVTKKMSPRSVVCHGGFCRLVR